MRKLERIFCDIDVSGETMALAVQQSAHRVNTNMRNMAHIKIYLDNMYYNDTYYTCTCRTVHMDNI